MSLIVPIMKPQIMAGGTTLKNGLVVVYELDETTGNTAFDAYGSNDGVNTNAIIDQPGAIGRAYNLNAAGYVTLPNIFSSYSYGTISFWVYRNVSANFQDIFFYGVGTNQYNSIFAQLSYSAYPNKVFFSVRNSTGYVLEARGSTSLATLAWYHVVISMSSSGLKMYVNNSLETLSFFRGTSTTVGWFNVPVGTQEAFIGRVRYNGTYIVRSDIKIDQFSIWDRALTTEEISTLYNSGNGLEYINW